MSVPTWKRPEKTELDLFVEAMEFSLYILKITNNNKIFTEDFQTSITDRLIQLSMDMYLNLWKANNRKLDDEERRRLQYLVLDNCIDFLAIYNLAIRAFHLKNNRTEFIVGKVILIRDTTRKWIKNDINRLKEKSKESDNIESEVI